MVQWPEDATPEYVAPEALLVRGILAADDGAPGFSTEYGNWQGCHHTRAKAFKKIEGQRIKFGGPPGIMSPDYSMSERYPTKRSPLAVQSRYYQVALKPINRDRYYGKVNGSCVYITRVARGRWSIWWGNEMYGYTRTLGNALRTMSELRENSEGHLRLRFREKVREVRRRHYLCSERKFTAAIRKRFLKMHTRFRLGLKKRSIGAKSRS